MSDYPAQIDTDGHGAVMYEYPGRATNAHAWGPQKAATPSFATEALQTPDAVAGWSSVTHRAAVSPTDYPGYLVERSTPGFDWFERVHIVPRFFAFGSVLSQIQDTFELYSAYRTANVQLNSFTNTVDPGVTVPDLPSLPYGLGPQSGVELTIQVDPVGAVSFSGDLLFTFDVQVVPLAISGERLILWFFVPEAPVTERLMFLTGIISKRKGTEQRICKRPFPRQLFPLRYKLQDRERRQALVRLMDWQGRTFGLPMWQEAVSLTAAASSTDTVNVWQTAYSDFRVGGLAAVYHDSDTYDVLVVAAKTATTIQFTTQLQNSYVAGDHVVPVRTAQAGQRGEGSRWPIRAEAIDLEWEVLDNEVSIASLAGFSSYDGKALFTENFVGGTSPEEFLFRVYDVDGETGVVERQILWEQNKRTGQLQLLGRNRQQVWEIRQALHALKGKQKTFYVLAAADDLVVVANLSATSNKMDIEHIGYSRFAQDRMPKSDFRITFTDGSQLDRVVIDSEEIDADTERLSLDDVWPSTKTPSEVSRVEFIELVRFDTDEFRIEHERVGMARVSAPVKAVFES